MEVPYEAIKVIVVSLKECELNGLFVDTKEVVE